MISGLRKTHLGSLGGETQGGILWSVGYQQPVE